MTLLYPFRLERKSVFVVELEGESMTLVYSLALFVNGTLLIL